MKKCDFSYLMHAMSESRPYMAALSTLNVFYHENTVVTIATNKRT